MENIGSKLVIMGFINLLCMIVNIGYSMSNDNLMGKIQSLESKSAWSEKEIFTLRANMQKQNNRNGLSESYLKELIK